jgi:hypothetical protein
MIGNPEIFREGNDAQCDIRVSPDFTKLSRLQKFAQRPTQKPGTFVLIQSLNFNLFWSDSPKGRVVGAARIEALARKAVMKDMPQFSAFRAIKGQPAQGKIAASFTQELP